MNSTTIKSLRLPNALIARANERAETLGLSFTDVVVDALSSTLGAEREPRTALLIEVANLLSSAFAENFPPDVTRQVFLEIQNNTTLLSLYKSAIKNERGEETETTRSSVHRMVGKVIKRVLHCEVTGRAICPDPEELIGSYALLAPAAS